MGIFNTKIDRRKFINLLTGSGLALISGCSKKANPVNKTDPPPPPPTEPQVKKIALLKTTDRKEGVTRVMEMLEFPDMNGKHVIVKPNFNTADPPPASTHNDTLRQIIVEIKKRSASEVTLAERSYRNFEQVIDNKGMSEMASDLGFNIKSLEADNTRHYWKSNMTHWNNGFELPETIANAEYIVSTCCLKTHHTGVITMALKLGVGILPSLHMQELHGSSRINSMIAEINMAYRPKLIVMDGVKTFIDGGPSHGTVKDGNVIIAGTDRIAIDAVGTAVLKDLGSTRVQGKIFDLEQIKRACEIRIGITSPSQIEFVTDDTVSSDYAEVLAEILTQG